MKPFNPNWNILTELRRGFVKESLSEKVYWKDLETLYQYDCTFAQRIGWKWDSVLKELGRLGVMNFDSFLPLVDWGCGTGIASSKFLSFFGSQAISELVLWDRSDLALNYAENKLRDNFPGLKIRTDLSNFNSCDFILLVSHVLNELCPKAHQELFSLINKARIVIWVEPGTPQSSQTLIQYREQMREKFTFVLPCPHQSTCGLFEKNSSDWCHFFAKPPQSIFQDAFWSGFSKKMGIDLRALPVSYWVAISSSLKMPLVSEPRVSEKRLLGRARHYKGYSLALVCEEKGVREEKLLQKESRETIEILRENPFHPKLYCSES